MPGTPATAPQNQASDEAFVEMSPAQLQQLLAATAVSPDKLSEALGLSAEEAGQLKSGQSPLRMTPAQYDKLKAAAARALAKQGDGTQDKSGDWGCSKSPAPTGPAPMTEVPSETATRTTMTEKTPGGGTAAALPNGGKVGSGTVTLRTGFEAKMDGDTDFSKDWFAIGYQGADAKDAHWLQFINREVVGVKDDGTSFALTDTNTNAFNRSYKLTPGGTGTSFGTATAENFTTDTGTTDNPFYESDGTGNNRSADSTMIYDRPGSSQGFAKKAFDAGAKKVYSRAHFHTFLVKKNVVTFMVVLDLEWVYNAATDTPRPTQTPGASGSASALPSEIASAFHSQFPKYAFIK